MTPTVRVRAGHGALCGLAAAVGACTASAPAQPSFQDDVMPILAANCVRCHAVPSIGGAPGATACTTPAGGGVTWCGLRLDSYDDTIVDEGDPADPDDDVGVRGAAFYAPIIPQRLASTTDPMPPRFPLGDVERETVIAWAQGDPPARTPRADNQAPTIAVVEASRAAGVVTLGYTLDDRDGDLAQGGLRARGPAGDRLIAPLAAGTDLVTWDTRGIAAGTYQLVARVDDGGGWIELAAGELVIDAAARGREAP